VGNREGDAVMTQDRRIRDSSPRGDLAQGQTVRPQRLNLGDEALVVGQEVLAGAALAAKSFVKAPDAEPTSSARNPGTSVAARRPAELATTRLACALVAPGPWPWMYRAMAAALPTRRGPGRQPAPRRERGTMIDEVARRRLRGLEPPEPTILEPRR
jgi:hypothetical protein